MPKTMTQRRKQHEETRRKHAPLYQPHLPSQAQDPSHQQAHSKLDPPLAVIADHSPDGILHLARQYLNTLVTRLDESEAQNHAQDEWDVHDDKEQAALLLELRGMMGYMLQKIEGKDVEKARADSVMNGVTGSEDDEREEEESAENEAGEEAADGVDEDDRPEDEQEEDEEEDLQADDQPNEEDATEQAFQDVLDEDGDDAENEPEEEEEKAQEDEPSDPPGQEDEEDENEDSGILISHPDLPTQENSTLRDGAEGVAPLEEQNDTDNAGEDDDDDDDDDHSALCESCATLLSSQENMQDEESPSIDAQLENNGDNETGIPTTDETPQITTTHDDETPVFASVKVGDKIKKKRKKRRVVPPNPNAQSIDADQKQIQDQAPTEAPAEAGEEEGERREIFRPSIRQQDEKLSLRMGEDGLEVVMERPPPVVRSVRKRRKPRLASDPAPVPASGLSEDFGADQARDEDGVGAEVEAGEEAQEPTDAQKATALIEAMISAQPSSSPPQPQSQPSPLSPTTKQTLESALEEETPASELNDNDPFALSHGMAPSSVKESLPQQALQAPAPVEEIVTPNPSPRDVVEAREAGTPSPARASARARFATPPSRKREVKSVRATEIIEYAYPTELEFSTPTSTTSTNTSITTRSPRRRTIIIRRPGAGSRLLTGVSTLGTSLYASLPSLAAPARSRQSDRQSQRPSDGVEDIASAALPARHVRPTSSARVGAVYVDADAAARVADAVAPLHRSGSSGVLDGLCDAIVAVYVAVLQVLEDTFRTLKGGLKEAVRLYREDDAVRCIVWGVVVWRVCVLWGVL